MAPKIIFVVFFIFLYLELQPSKAQTWIRAGYWYSGSEFPSSEINSTLFTHLLCAFAGLNSTSYELSLSPSDEQKFSNFTDTVKQKNPLVITILSIKGGAEDYSNFSLMVSNQSYRKSFIESSIRTARLYGFQGLDFSWSSIKTSSDSLHMGELFREWRAAIESEAGNSSQTQLILTAAVQFQPRLDGGSYPIESMKKYLNWVNVNAYDYHNPQSDNVTAAPAALYDPLRIVNSDYGIEAWINGGLSPNMLLLGLPFYGYAWTLLNPENNGIGAPATGPAITQDGDMSYKDIKNYIQRNGANVMYNSTYVVNYCTIGTSWIGYDDVEVVKIKVSYAKEKKLLGYNAWQIAHDDNWILSQAAAQKDEIVISSPPNNRAKRQNKRHLLVIVFTTTAAVILLVGFLMCYFWIRNLNLKGTLASAAQSKNRADKAAAVGELSSNGPNLKYYTLSETEAATNGFSVENKLGEGGYGPVYKGILPDGQEIAVKKLSKSSKQGYEEFRNEVVLTAKLLHVNLVRVLGFCIDKEEQMLIYEYMPNKSLDYYLFDPINRFVLNWKKRVDIIEGVTQGLLYLQEYSRMIIIHRDLKASNFLLDKNMKPKISDFGMARIFVEDDQVEANTGRIVGTYGYVPPEYVKRGIYSTKSDVYSFGVLLLQIISGKKVSCFYGVHENLTLLEYAYELWKDGKSMEFMDDSLDDIDSSCKLIRCLQIALLCVQENANDRPSMLEVSSMLKNETTYVNVPHKPAFSKGTENEQNKPTTRCSVNDVTVSEVAAR